MKNVNFKNQKEIKLYDTKNQKDEFVSGYTNGYKEYKSYMNKYTYIRPNELTSEEMGKESIKYMYAIEYKHPLDNSKILVCKTWMKIPKSIIWKYGCICEYFIEKYLKNRCNYIKEIG